MSARRSLAGVLLATALVACSGVSARPEDDAVARALGGPVARSLVTGAPEAWAEVLRAADHARGLSGRARADAEVELALSLEWAQSVAERAASERALADTTTQSVVLTEEQTRLTADIAHLNESLRASALAHVQVSEVQRAARAPTAVEAARRGAVADDLDQQTELLLAAAELFGARPEAVNPLRARVATARSGGAGRLAASAAAYRDAEALLDTTRASGSVVSTADVDALRLQASLSENEGVDAQRDTRGVVAVLRGLFAGPRLGPASRSRVELLGRVIRSHGSLPVRIECFVGGVPAAGAVVARAQANALRTALIAAGVPAERLQAAGYSRAAGSARTEDRAEIVLLMPRAE